MAVVHRTTLVPGKLDLLTSWLPAQSWHVRTAAARPELSRAGGFRLDDPEGEVGIEFMIALDQAATDVVAYLIPMTYRGSPLAGAEDALIGTAEHGVLGTRWIYDGIRDPVLLTQLGELIEGRAQARAQTVSDAPDPTVLSSPPRVAPGERLGFRFARVLTPAVREPAEPGQVTGPWTRPDGTVVRSVFVTSQRVPD